MSLREPDIPRQIPSDREYRPETEPERRRKALLKRADSFLTQLGRMTEEMRAMRDELSSLKIKS